MDTTEKDIRDLFVSSKPLDRDEVAMLLLQLVERIQNLERAPKRKPLTHEQRFDLLTKFESHKHKWEAPAILIDMVEAAHNIKEST